MLTAIIVAAGDSRRMGFDKLFAAVAGKPLIAHTIRAFERAGAVDGIIVVAREDRHDEIKTIVRDENFKKVRSIIPGGKRRQDSVRAGLEHLESSARYVAVHDAARPLITAGQIEGVLAQCQTYGAAALAEPVNDTLKTLWQANSPFLFQFFHLRRPFLLNWNAARGFLMKRVGCRFRRSNPSRLQNRNAVRQKQPSWVFVRRFCSGGLLVAP